MERHDGSGSKARPKSGSVRAQMDDKVCTGLKHRAEIRGREDGDGSACYLQTKYVFLGFPGSEGVQRYTCDVLCWGSGCR